MAKQHRRPNKQMPPFEGDSRNEIGEKSAADRRERAARLMGDIEIIVDAFERVYEHIKIQPHETSAQELLRLLIDELREEKDAAPSGTPGGPAP